MIPPAALFLLLIAPRVFLSYAHADSQAARDIAAELRRAGCIVWCDRSHLRPGEPWAPAIEAAIDHAHLIVAVIGAPCRTCRQEQARAVRLDKPIIVILLSPAARRPLYLEEYPTLNTAEFRQRTMEICAPHYTPE